MRLPIPVELRRRTILGLVAGGALTSSLVGRAAYADCLPDTVDAPPPGIDESPARASFTRAPAASVFLDVSGSMAGYVSPAPPSGSKKPTGPAEPRVFRDIVLSLPQLAASVADHFALFAFGHTIRQISQADLAQGGHREFYADQASRIQDALTRMDALPIDELGILLTDLFLTGEEVFGGAAAIRAPLARILESGRAIGILGIRSGFAGTIYDIPGARNYTGATARPFYVILTGPPSLMSRFVREVETEILAPLPPPPDGESRSHFTLFSRNPSGAGIIRLPLVPHAPAQMSDLMAPDLGGAVTRVSFPSAAGTVSANLDIDALAEHGMLLPDEFRLKEELWASPPRNVGNTGCSETWVPIHSLKDVAHLSNDATQGGPTSVIIGGPALQRATPGVTFLLRARVEATGISATPAKTAWARAWNLEARDTEPYMAGQPKLFRTLNLREIVVMLEGLVRDQLEPHFVAEALLAFQVSKA